jgi:hypothetical protein
MHARRIQTMNFATMVSSATVNNMYVRAVALQKGR